MWTNGLKLCTAAEFFTFNMKATERDCNEIKKKQQIQFKWFMVMVSYGLK